MSDRKQWLIIRQRSTELKPKSDGFLFTRIPYTKCLPGRQTGRDAVLFLDKPLSEGSRPKDPVGGKVRWKQDSTSGLSNIFCSDTNYPITDPFPDKLVGTTDNNLKDPIEIIVIITIILFV
ncbi:MAG: hypothetical protein IID16_12270 [Candidatus Marinimicrobia bacterium]|nr:hypothetical protein [Candidatus Neomarinimicrobiota bacterium]